MVYSVNFKPYVKPVRMAGLTQTHQMETVQDLTQKSLEQLQSIRQLQNTTQQTSSVLALELDIIQQLQQLAPQMGHVVQQKLTQQAELAITQLNTLLTAKRQSIGNSAPKRNPTKAEVNALYSLFHDLTSKDQEMARSAEQTLKKLGLSDERIRQLKQIDTKEKSKHIRFGNSRPQPFTTVYEQALHEIIDHNSVDQVVGAVSDHHVNNFIRHLQPLAFGAGGYRTVGYDHNGYPITEWDANLY